MAILTLAMATPTASFAQVAVIVDGPSDLADARTAKLATEVQQLTRDDPSPIRIPTKPTHVGDFTLAGTKAQLKAALADRSVKAIIGFGLLAGIAAGDLSGPPRKPIILPYAAPRIQGLPRAKRGTGVRNLAYITGLVDFDRDLKRFREVIRDRKVGFVIDDFIWQTFLKRKPDDIKSPAEGRDDVVIVPIPNDVDAALAAMPKDIEAVYLFSHFRMSFEGMRKFINELNARKLATYAAAGPQWVDQGAMVTLVPADL
ncbi:MAG: hypothetical protein AAFN74_01635, partial [Myxococcota bacterium]